MKNKFLVVATFATLSLISCKENSNQEETTVTTSTEVTTTDTIVSAEEKVAGTYKTSVPGANSMMDIELILNSDKTFIKNTVYVDKNNEKSTDKGTFIIENDLMILDLDSTKHITKYKIGKGFLQQLDIAGNEITGADAEKFKFKKQ